MIKRKQNRDMWNSFFKDLRRPLRDQITSVVIDQISVSSWAIIAKVLQVEFELKIKKWIVGSND